MPKIPPLVLDIMVCDAIEASVVGDREAMIDAVSPLHEVGDSGDGWMFVLGCIDIVAQTMPTPRPDSVISIGIVPVGEDGQPETEDCSITPEMEQRVPGLVAYLRMLAAYLRDDPDMSVALWHAAIENGFVADLLVSAIRAAADVTVARRSGLQ